MTLNETKNLSKLFTSNQQRLLDSYNLPYRTFVLYGVDAIHPFTQTTDDLYGKQVNRKNYRLLKRYGFTNQLSEKAHYYMLLLMWSTMKSSTYTDLVGKNPADYVTNYVKYLYRDSFALMDEITNQRIKLFINKMPQVVRTNDLILLLGQINNILYRYSLDSYMTPYRKHFVLNADNYKQLNAKMNVNSNSELTLTFVINWLIERYTIMEQNQFKDKDVYNYFFVLSEIIHFFH